MSDIRRILCPVDRSESSQQALRQAALLAAKLNACLTVLHVMEMPLPPNPEVIGPAEWRAAEREEDVRTWMDADAHAAGAVPHRLQLAIRRGRPHLEIAAVAASINANLLVMGTHGHRGFQRLVLGSVTERVVPRVACPVLTVPPHVTAIHEGPFARVLCAVDFSEASLRATEFVMASALAADAQIVLAHVEDWPALNTPPLQFENLSLEEDEALGRLRDRQEASACERLRALVPENLADRCSMVMGRGPAAAELERLATEQQADLIVMGVRGHGVAGLPAFGSTTLQVIRHVAVPVLSLG